MRGNLGGTAVLKCKAVPWGIHGAAFLFFEGDWEWQENVITGWTS